MVVVVSPGAEQVWQGDRAGMLNLLSRTQLQCSKGENGQAFSDCLTVFVFRLWIDPCHKIRAEDVCCFVACIFGKWQASLGS